MMEDLEQFRTDFLQSIFVRAAGDRNFRHTAFAESSLEMLAEAEEAADVQICYYRGIGSRGRRLAVDAYCVDEADDALRLFIVDDFRGDLSPSTLDKTQAKSLFDRLRAFVEDSSDGRLVQSIEESLQAHELASIINKSKGSFAKFRFYLVTESVLSTRVKDWPEGTIQDVPVEYHIWDMSRFHRIAASQTGRDDLEVDFRDFVPDGVPCLAASVNADEYGAYLCVLPGDVLAGIYDRYGSRLLEGNVRSYLMTTGKVNKAIHKTINVEPQMFFAFNNGISTTATAVDISEDKFGKRLLSATDFQIVNGGQTTASLYWARRKDKADLARTFVQMKLAVIPTESAGAIIPQISKCANSQNKVSDADFFSNHDFHRRMEEFSRRTWVPSVGSQQFETHWFYERARGQYHNEIAGLTPAQRKLFEAKNPRKQLFTKTDLAKFENVWRKVPHIVAKGAQKNFLAFAEYVTKEWERSPDQFNESYFKEIVGRAILFRRTEQLVSAQDWYDGGYRAQTVAYTVSKLAVLIEQEAPGKTLDFRSIWQRQDLSEPLVAQLELVASAMFDVATTPEAGIQNVGEWCKKELCWERAKAKKVKLLPTLREELVDREEVSAIRKDAKKQQQMENGIVAQTEVVKLGGAFWQKLHQWASRKGFLETETEKLLRTAISIPKKIPLEWQAATLLRFKKRMEDEGFGWK